MTDNTNLLTEYVRSGSDAAFRELVTHYVDLVHSAAIRMVGGDAHRAKDVAQTVFVDLARKAKTLPADVKLGGWLHRHTCFVASNMMRGERRRQIREKQAAEMNTIQDHSDADYSLVAPLLDEAINALGEADRAAIQLRFFEHHDFRDVGRVLGSSEDAARMRVTRALEKLGSYLKRRGITSTAVSLGVVLSTNAVQAAPAGLAVKITSAALASSSLASTASTTTTIQKLIIQTLAMTTLQKSAIAATFALAGGWLGIQYHSLASVADSNVILREQITIARTNSIAETTSTAKSVALVSHAKGKGAMDWKSIGAQLEESQKNGGMGDMRMMMDFRQKVHAMSKEELVAALGEVFALELPIRSRAILEQILSAPLIKMDPELALNSLIDFVQDRDSTIARQLSLAMTKWAAKDPGKAAAWLDQQIAAGKFDSKSLSGTNEARGQIEGGLIFALLSTDPDAAALRLGAIPEGQRSQALTELWSWGSKEENQLAFAKMVRDQLSQEEQIGILPQMTSTIFITDGYEKATEYLDRIGATPAERSACVKQVALNIIDEADKGDPRKDLSEIREWVGNQAPKDLGRITGEALDIASIGGRVKFSEAADLAVEYDKVSGNDEVLTTFLKSMSAQMHKEEARILAAQISDIKTREEILDRLQ